MTPVVSWPVFQRWCPWYLVRSAWTMPPSCSPVGAVTAGSGAGERGSGWLGPGGEETGICVHFSAVIGIGTGTLTGTAIVTVSVAGGRWPCHGNGVGSGSVTKTASGSLTRSDGETAA